MQITLSLISHEIENAVIPQRAKDGYINATAMCNAVGKKFNDYSRIGPDRRVCRKDWAAVTGLPATGLIVTFQGGKPENYRILGCARMWR